MLSIFSFLKNKNMKVEVNKSKCPHNHICPLIRECPVNAITQNNEGYPVVDYNLCIECGKCLKYCPMKAMTGIND